MENFLLSIFDEIWPETMYYTIVQELLPDFGATVKNIKNPILIGISSKFLHNISTCIRIRKNYKNGEFSPTHF